MIQGLCQIIVSFLAFTIGLRTCDSVDTAELQHSTDPTNDEKRWTFYDLEAHGALLQKLGRLLTGIIWVYLGTICKMEFQVYKYCLP